VVFLRINPFEKDDYNITTCLYRKAISYRSYVNIQIVEFQVSEMSDDGSDGDK
jgi:hypothetical protein